MLTAKGARLYPSWFFQVGFTAFVPLAAGLPSWLDQVGLTAHVGLPSWFAFRDCGADRQGDEALSKLAYHIVFTKLVPLAAGLPSWLVQVGPIVQVGFTMWIA